jgi:Phage major coat protein, Gp8
MKNVMQNTKAKLAVVIAVSLGAVSSAHAALDAAVAAAFTAVSTDVADMTEAAWPILIAVTTAIIGMKLFKKFTGRST